MLTATLILLRWLLRRLLYSKHIIAVVALSDRTTPLIRCTHKMNLQGEKSAHSAHQGEQQLDMSGMLNGRGEKAAPAGGPRCLWSATAAITRSYKTRHKMSHLHRITA